MIRMLRAHMSEGESIFSDGLLSADPFIQGVRSYLKEYRYENAKSAQFWKAMAESTQSSKFSTIAEDMQSWIAMPNYPVLQAEWKTTVPRPGRSAAAFPAALPGNRSWHL